MKYVLLVATLFLTAEVILAQSDCQPTDCMAAKVDAKDMSSTLKLLPTNHLASKKVEKSAVAQTCESQLPAECRPVAENCYPEECCCCPPECIPVCCSDIVESVSAATAKLDAAIALMTAVRME
jgi:hypothetical protein